MQKFEGTFWSNEEIPMVRYGDLDSGDIFTQPEFGATWFVKIDSDGAFPVNNQYSVTDGGAEYFDGETLVRPVCFNS